MVASPLSGAGDWGVGEPSLYERKKVDDPVLPVVRTSEPYDPSGAGCKLGRKHLHGMVQEEQCAVAVGRDDLDYLDAVERQGRGCLRARRDEA